MPAGVDDLFARRTRIIYGCLAAVIGVFIGRLYLLQVINADKYRGDAHSNSQKDALIEAPRGLVFDRKGRLLVGNRKSFDLVLDRNHLKAAPQAATWVAQLTGETPARILERIRSADPTSHHPVVVASDLSFSQVAFVEARREDVPGLAIATTIQRMYPNGRLAAHVLGYVGEIDEREIGKPGMEAHRAGDIVGKAGIERQYDDLLSGRPGIRQTMVDNIGREISTRVTQQPVSGADLHLGLDLDVQRAAEAGLADRRGAVVMLDARTGSVIAIASAPTYEPNAFVGGISQVRWNELHDDPHLPLSFRAIAGLYPPGSVWKALVSGAALQSGRHKPSMTVTCTGSVWIYGRERHCWKEDGHGTVNMHQAFVHSCNVYYYTAGKDVGVDPIHELGAEIGFGKPTGIDLPGEKGGTLPDDAWKREHVHEQWYPGDTINMAIGQGFLEITPLQAAVLGMSIGNGGFVHQPHVLETAIDPLTGGIVKKVDVVTATPVPWKPETLAFLKEAMEDVVKSGTGTRAQLPGVRVAGKTGTAQPSSGEAPKGMPKDQRPERYQEHAWFMGFAPVDNPEVSFAIVLEHVGLHGGEAAAPIAHDILAAWFADRGMVAGQ